jgi:hypothetical protein
MDVSPNGCGSTPSLGDTSFSTSFSQPLYNEAKNGYSTSGTSVGTNPKIQLITYNNESRWENNQYVYYLKPVVQVTAKNDVVAQGQYYRDQYNNLVTVKSGSAESGDVANATPSTNKISTTGIDMP